MEGHDESPEARRRARELRRLATPWEAILWRGLREGPRRWRRSHPFHGFFLDLYCDAARLTLRFTNVEIGADPRGCLARIRATEEDRAERFGKR